MKKGVFYLLLIILFAGLILASLNVTLSDQGADVKDKSTGDALTTGTITVEIWDAASDGTLIYSENFTNAIINGSWNIILGENSSNPLPLQFGKAYYKNYKINGEDLNFTSLNGSSTDRQLFYSPLGDIGGEDINQQSNFTFFGINITKILNLIPSLDPTTANQGTIFFNSSLNAPMFYNGSDWAGLGFWRNVGTNLFVQDATLNVGIGTASPLSILHVVGNGLFAGNLNVTGNLTITGTTGGATPEANTTYAEALPKAWVNFNGASCSGTSGSCTTASCLIRDSFNVECVDRTATGVYQAYWDRNFADSNYSVVGSCNFDATNTCQWIRIEARNQSQAGIVGAAQSAAAANSQIISVLAFGNQ